MANHKSSLKRIRSNETKKNQNRYQAKTVRNAVRKFRDLSEKPAATEQLPDVLSMIDKLAKKTVIHKNKAANLKSKLMKKVNHM